MDLDRLHRYPLIRILIPLLGGILFAEYVGLNINIFGLISLAIVLFISFYWLHRRCSAYKFRWISGVLIAAIFFVFGMIRVQQIASHSRLTRELDYYTAVVKSRSTSDKRFVKYTVLIDGDTNQKAFLYHYIDSLPSNYKVGDVVGIRGELKQPDAPLFTEDFDYASYLKYKRVNGVFYLNYDAVRLVGDVSGTWPYWLYMYRDKILDRYKELGIQGDQLALISALTLGVKDDFTDELKSSYSDAGVSHVLALSGLHIGLLFVLLFYAFKLLFYRLNCRDTLSLILSMLMIWLFVLFVGASPSVVRSASLYSLLAIARVFRRDRISLNSLAFVAVVLLLYNPYWIFDLGFILSFSAVTSILLFQPLFENYYRPKHPVLNYLWQLILISFVAQLGTLPWTIYYFHSVPIYFLVANVLVIPLVTVLLYVLVVFVFVLWVPYASLWMSKLVLFLSATLNEIVVFISDLPLSSIKEIYLYQSELVALFLLICSFYYLIKKRGSKGLQLFLASIIFFQSICWVELWRHQPDYSLKLITQGRGSYFECAAPNGSLYILKNDSSIDLHKVEKWNFNRWSHNQFELKQKLNKDFSNRQVYWRNGVLAFQQKRFLIASKHTALHRKHFDTSLTFDYLFADTKNINTIRNLMDIYRFKAILLPNSLSNTHKETFIQICKENNLNFILLPKKAYIEFL